MLTFSFDLGAYMLHLSLIKVQGKDTVHASLTDGVSAEPVAEQDLDLKGFIRGIKLITGSR